MKHAIDSTEVIASHLVCCRCDIRHRINKYCCVCVLIVDVIVEVVTCEIKLF